MEGKSDNQNCYQIFKSKAKVSIPGVGLQNVTIKEGGYCDLILLDSQRSLCIAHERHSYLR
jgi:hypothetical protein